MSEGNFRTPMAWQHRNLVNHGYSMTSVGNNSSEFRSNRGAKYYNNTPSTPGSNRYGKPPNTPSSAHSRGTLGNESNRRDTRESSADRYSHRSRNANKGTPRMSYNPSGSGRTHRSSNSYGGASKSSYTRSHHSPSSTDETMEETTETESQINGEMPPNTNDYGRQMIPGYAIPLSYQSPAIMAPVSHTAPFVPAQFMMASNGSIRSVHSMPVLSPPTGSSHTWDGEPCPVHHSGAPVPLAALYGMSVPPRIGHSSVPPSVISGATTTVRRARSVAEMSSCAGRLDSNKSFHGSMNLQPRIVLTENGTPSTLPVRDMSKLRNGTLTRSSVASDKSSPSVNCCSGGFIVIWIILGIITFGILLGIVLKFTVA